MGINLYGTYVEFVECSQADDGIHVDIFSTLSVNQLGPDRTIERIDLSPSPPKISEKRNCIFL